MPKRVVFCCCCCDSCLSVVHWTDRPWMTLSAYIAWTGRPRPKKELIITGNRSDRFFYDYKIKKLSSFSTLHMFELAPKFEN